MKMSASRVTGIKPGANETMFTFEQQAIRWHA